MSDATNANAHQLFVAGMTEIGLGNGSPGWIEHDVNGQLVRDSFSLEGEIYFGFEQIKALIDQLRSAGQIPIKDHLIAQAVSQLTEVARQYHATGQLRARIAEIVVPLLKGRQP